MEVLFYAGLGIGALTGYLLNVVYRTPKDEYKKIKQLDEEAEV